MRGHFLLQTTIGDEYLAAVKGRAEHTHAGTEESTAIVSMAQLQD
jgi:hypothetical protein